VILLPKEVSVDSCKNSQWQHLMAVAAFNLVVTEEQCLAEVTQELNDRQKMKPYQREREAFYILCPASSLMDVPGYVNPDKLMNVPIGFVCR